MVTPPEALYSNLLLDLADAVGHQTLDFIIKNGVQWPGMTYREMAALSIEKSLLKKLEVRNNDALDSAALEKFLLCNKRCENWSLQLKSSWDEVLVGELKRALHEFWNRDGLPLVDHWYDVLDKSRVGPGAAIEARGGDFYTKLFSSKLSCTSQNLYFWYKRYIRGFPEWTNAENIRLATYGDPVISAGNRLSFVPKNDKTSRTICVEPSLNMFFQLGFSHHIEFRLLERLGINLSQQQYKNRDLARRGSIDDSFATIDLESASDSISWTMLQAVLPKDFSQILGALRSESTIDKSGKSHKLFMVSTMGNGFTFSIQTMLFACLVQACFRARDLPIMFPRGNDTGNFGINGDDIVVPRRIVNDVYRLLDILGFSVNREKSFDEGPFRESCGADYFRGRDVRGVYCKRLSTPQDRYAVINALNLFSSKTGVQLPRTVQYLLKSVKYLRVPRWEDSSSGIQVPGSLVEDLPLSITTQSILYSRYVPIAKKIRILESALLVPPGLKSRIYNPSGLFISFLQRSINSYSIGVRHDPPRYKRKLGIAPYWDALPTVHPLAGWFNWKRWNTACYINLFG